MAPVDECLNELQKLSDQIQRALIDGDVSHVQQLVLEQCKYIAQIPEGAKLSTRDVEQVKSLVVKVQRQQALIGQASSVAEFFIRQAQVQGQGAFSCLA